MTDPKVKTIPFEPWHFRQPWCARAWHAARTSRRWCRRVAKLCREPGALRVMDLRAKQQMVVEAIEDVKGYDILVFNTARCPRCSSAW